MVFDWLSIGVQTGLIAAVLAGFLAVIRFRMSKWVSLGFVRMMKKLQTDATAEGTPEGASTSTSGAFSVGGIPVGAILQVISDPGVQKLIDRFLNRGSSGGGGW